jgi:hypothetical protein
MKRSGFEVGSAKKNCHVRDSYKASYELINARVTSQMRTSGYPSDLGECIGDHALVEIRRFQMAEKPPSTDNSTPFT